MRPNPLFLLLLSLASHLCAASPDLNWIVNGDFKGKGGWEGPLRPVPGREGGQAAFFENLTPLWSQLRQRVDFPHPPPKSIEISGWLKAEKVVRGAQDWEAARITVVFYDKGGQRLGDWPAPIAQLTGTLDWETYSNSYTLPSGAAYAMVELSLGNCTGRVWFQDLALHAYDHDQMPLSKGAPGHPDRKPPSRVSTENWLVNPGFETPGSGDWGQISLALPGRGSAHCLKKSNAAPSWNLSGQVVSFQGRTPAHVVYSGWVKTRGVVPGKENWERARLNVDFRDADNQQVGGWQASVCEVSGDKDWTRFERRYPVPPGATQLYADAGLGNCTGTAWFDDLSLVLLSSSGETLTASLVMEQATDTSDWYAYEPPKGASDTALDLSFLNEKPAGKRGFVKVTDGHFTFADGTPVRFWGTNFVGPNLFLTHEQSDAMALRLSKLGVNLLRFHFLDNDWGGVNLFDPKADHTQSFLPASLEKVDYLIAALKKQGIYLYIDLSVGRKFRPGDGVPGASELEMGAKGVIHFSRKVIDLNKKYAEALLSRVNPYTGMALKDDPVYVMSEIVNESSIFSGFGEQAYPQPFWEELQSLFEEWAGTHSTELRAGGKVTRFKFEWEAQKLVPTANPENEQESLRFLLETVKKSNQEMKAFLAKVSPHALLAGSNMGLPVLAEIQANSLLDFVDTHAYWDHPQIWNVQGGWANVAKAPFNNTSLLRNPFQGSLLFGLSHAPVSGKPLFVSEWNDCFPNEWRLEGPPLMAAYGCLQDWDGLLQFAYGPEKPGTVRMTSFDLNTRPDNEPLFQAGALLFRQGLMKPSDIAAVEPVSDAEVFAKGSKAEGLFKYPFLPYVTRQLKKFTGKVEVPDTGLGGLEKLHDGKAKTIRGSTGEHLLDYGKGVLRLDSPFVKGFVGQIGTEEILRSRGFALKVGKRNPWAAVMALSLDRQPLESSKRILLVAQAKAENSGQVFNNTRTALKEPGGPPVLMQGVSAGLSLRVTGKSYKITALDPSGKAGAALKWGLEKGVLRFVISPRDRSATYLVTAVE